MSVMPKKYVGVSSLPPKRLLKRIEGETIRYTPSMSFLSVSKFMRIHRDESVYYGKCTKSNVMVFYHRAKKRDGGSTGFYGKVIENGKGSRIVGYFRKPVYAYIAAALLLAACLLCALGTYASGAKDGALIFLGIGLVGGMFMLWDRHDVQLRGFFENIIGCYEADEKADSSAKES